MSRYVALIGNADGAYGVVFPDAPGCTAMAGTQGQAIVDAAAALVEWRADEIASGRQIAEPRSADILKLDPDVQLALEQGAILVSVPNVTDPGYVSETDDLAEWLEEFRDKVAAGAQAARSGDFATNEDIAAVLNKYRPK